MPQKNDFSSIFFNNEYKELTGKRNAVVFRLAVLLVFTLAALGFAIGGLQQLEERMNNPFTNWVDLDISPPLEKKLPELNVFIQDRDTLDKYHLDETSSWNKYFLFFHHRNNNAVTDSIATNVTFKFGRTIDFEDDLFREIVKEGSPNLLYRNRDVFDSNGDVMSTCGVIVTASVMERLGYSKEEYSSVKRLTVDWNQGKFLLFLDLIGVVKQLPSLSDFVSSNHLYNITQKGYGKYVERNSPQDSTKIRLLSLQSGQAEVLRKKVKEELGTEDFEIWEDPLQVDTLEQYFGYVISMLETQSPGAEAVQNFIRSCKSDLGFTDYSFINCGSDADRIEDPHQLTFNFKDLDKIRDFYAVLYNQFDAELSMESVESRENFRMVSRLTSILGSVLFGFGLLSILLYLGNLIQNHISSIKPNLGTLKAMGLSNILLRSTYSKVILKLMGVGLLIALPASLLVGKILDRVLLQIGFNLFHWAIPIAILLILAVVFYLVRSILNHALAGTPGDLIYERE